MAFRPSTISAHISVGPNLWAHYAGANNVNQFAVWVKRDLSVSLAERLLYLPTTWSTLDNFKSITNVDDNHNAWAICTDHEGYVWVTGNQHGTTPMRLWKSDAALSVVDGFTDVSSSHPGTTDSVTYPIFMPLSDGRVFHIWRHGAAGNGDTYYAILGTASPATWSSRTKLFDGMGQTPDYSAYHQGCHIDRNDRIHVAWCWREDSTSETKEFGYIYSDDDGTNWAAADGTAMTVPITRSNDTAAMIGDPTPPGSEVLGTQPSLAHDLATGDVYVTITTNTGQTRWYKRWNGTSWSETSLTVFDPQRLNPGVQAVWHDGALWGMSNRDGRAYQRPLVNTDSIENYYGRVVHNTPGGWSGPRFDPVLYNRTGQIQTLMVDENDDPVVYELGGVRAPVG